MRFFHASLFALCLLTVAPAGSVAADVRSDVTAAYAGSMLSLEICPKRLVGKIRQEQM